MKNPFKIHESYIIRHKILEALYNNDNSHGGQHQRIGSIDIATMTNIPIDKIHFYHQLLKEAEEIDCCEDDGQHWMELTNFGDYAFVKAKYMKEGRNEMWDYFYYPTRVILPIFTFGLAVVAFYINYTAYKDLKESRKNQIEYKDMTQQSLPAATQVDSIPSHQ